MRGRVIPLLLSLFLSTLLFPATAAAQCNYGQSFSAALRSTYFDAVAVNGELWAATGYGVQVLDRLSSPPQPVSLTAVPGVTRSIDVRDGVAYAGSGSVIHVLRKSGDGLEIVRSVNAGAAINDIVASSGSLFVATANGLLVFDRRDPLQPSSPVTLPTSSANVSSLARNGETELFAADGDATVEKFAISATPVPAGALSALQRSLAVTVTGNRIFVSDGQQTQLFTISGTPITTLPYGGTTVVSHRGDAFFMAGADRRFRAIDLTLPAQPVELFGADIIPSGGSVNRIGALVSAEGRLYVAGGDSGLPTFDTTAFAAPFPLRSHALGLKTSVVESASAVYVGNSTGGLTELTRFSSGALGVGRNWGGTQSHLVHAVANDLLLTSSGSTLTYWTVLSGSPAPISTAIMAGNIREAVLSGSVAIVLLEDRSYWSVDLSREQPTPVNLGSGTDRIAGSGEGLARVSITEQGTTEIRFYEGGVGTGQPAMMTVEGAATAVAMSGKRVAVFTFRGITIVDFSGAPVQTLLPQSTGALVRDLAFHGTHLIDVSAHSARVWDLEQRRVVRTFALPADGLAVSADPSAKTVTVLTTEGVVTLHYAAVGQQPERLPSTGTNHYATKIVTSAGHLFVLSGGSINIYVTSYGSAPSYTATIAAPGALDLAASDDALFVLFGNGTVTSFTRSGAPLRSMRIEEGPDAVPLAIHTARGAPWVSISRGCLSTGCEEKTVVLDPISLVPTATMAGGTRDLTVGGNVAYALIDTPPQTWIRAYDVTSPLQPALMASQPLDSSVARVAWHPGAVFALGTRLFTHTLPSLILSGQDLTTTVVSTSTDIAVEDGCAVITGRSADAELYRWSGSQWIPAGTIPLPGVARGISQQPGRIVILTDYSIEIWTNRAPTAPSRRRAL